MREGRTEKEHYLCNCQQDVSFGRSETGRDQEKSNIQLTIAQAEQSNPTLTPPPAPIAASCTPKGFSAVLLQAFRAPPTPPPPLR